MAACAWTASTPTTASARPITQVTILPQECIPYSYRVGPFNLSARLPGQYCTENVDECELMPNACQNGGTCHDTHGSYHCVCVNGWTGDDCSENIDDCAIAVCFNGATCHDRVASFFCECPVGKTGASALRKPLGLRKSVTAALTAVTVCVRFLLQVCSATWTTPA